MIIIVSGAACGGTVQGAPASELLACTERPIRSYPIGRPVPPHYVGLVPNYKMAKSSLIDFL